MVGLKGSSRLGRAALKPLHMQTKAVSGLEALVPILDGR